MKRIRRKKRKRKGDKEHKKSSLIKRFRKKRKKNKSESITTQEKSKILISDIDLLLNGSTEISNKETSKEREEIFVKYIQKSRNIIKTLNKELEIMKNKQNTTIDKLINKHKHELSQTVKYYLDSNSLSAFSLPFNDIGANLLDKKMCN